jgi:hydroxymethylbilane synthase
MDAPSTEAAASHHEPSTDIPPPEPIPRTVTLGTRSSLLALVQANSVEKSLKEAWPKQQYAIHSMKTLGDRDKVTALYNFGGKSLWTRDLEVLLMDKQLDMIVHCLKGV